MGGQHREVARSKELCDTGEARLRSNLDSNASSSRNRQTSTDVQTSAVAFQDIRADFEFKVVTQSQVFLSKRTVTLYPCVELHTDNLASHVDSFEKGLQSWFNPACCWLVYTMRSGGIC